MRRALRVTVVVVGVVLVMLVLIGLGYDDDEALSARMGVTTCLRDPRGYLTAQAVPTAQYVPCFTDAAAGWTVTTQEFSNSGATFSLVTDKVEGVTWDITFGPSCQPATGDTVNKAGSPATVYQQTVDGPDGKGVTRTEWMVFEGGCVVSVVALPGRLDRQLVFSETDELLTLIPRSVLDAEVRRQTNGQLSLDPAPSGGSSPSTAPASTTTTNTPRPSADRSPNPTSAGDDGPIDTVTPDTVTPDAVPSEPAAGDPGSSESPTDGGPG